MLYRRSLIGLLLALYLALLAWVGVNWDSHPSSKLMAARYALLLPAAALVIASARKSTGDGGVPRVPRHSAVLALYACGVLAGSIWLDTDAAGADERAYLFQASAFRQGRLAAEAPPGAGEVNNERKTEFFFIHHVIHDGKWTGKYPPGWPALLTAGMLFGVERFLNPLLGLLILWLTWRIARLLFDEMTARLSLVLLLLSPLFTFNCLGYLSHPSCGALLAAAVWLGLLGTRSKTGTWHFIGMFFCVAAAVPIRPYTAACAGAVIVPAALAWLLKTRRSVLLPVLAGGAVAGALTAGVSLLYDHAITGEYLRSTYALYSGAARIDAVDFAPANLLRNLTGNTPRSLFMTDLASVPFLFAAVLFAVAVGLHWRRETGKTLLLGLLSISLVAGHVSTYYISSARVGERFYFETMFAAAILAARGWLLLLDQRPALAHNLRWILAFTALIQVFHYAIFANIVRSAVEPYATMRATIGRAGLQNAVAFVKSAPRFDPGDFNANSAGWRRAPVFYLPDPGAARRDAITCLLGRSEWAVFTYRPGTKTVDAEGPVRADPATCGPAR
jgi:4-amino-4-deoxy-L-arabinose transferase-like glycosyltransferase